MKKISLLIGFTLLFPALLTAATKKDTLEVEPYVGMLFWDGKTKQESPSLFLGGRVGILIQDSFAAELAGGWSPAQLKDVDQNVYWIPYHLDFLYHLTLNENWAPFIAGGVGAASAFSGDERDSGFSLQWGLGVKYFFVNEFALRIDARHMAIFDVFDESHNDFELSMGLTMRFWDDPEPQPIVPRAPIIPVAPMPPTPAMKCPDVLACAQPLDDNGCPIDLDDDGVVDGCDLCPNTPACARPVDDDGCPIDSDGDGVSNGCDLCPTSSRLAVIDGSGCEVTQRVWVIKGPNFDFDKAEITPAAERVMSKIIETLQADKDMVLEIGGHCDSKGSYAYNQSLSERRAKAVLNFVVASGVVADGRLKVKGYSESKPVATNQTEVGRAKNRRVEFKVLNRPQDAKKKGEDGKKKKKKKKRRSAREK